MEYDSRFFVVLCGSFIRVDEDDVGRTLNLRWHLNQGVLIAKVDGQKVRLARFLLNVTDERFVFQRPGVQPNDFRKSSLIASSMSERQATLKPTDKFKTSRYKGVSLDTKTGLWRAGIRPNGHSICLGYFEDEKRAALVYNAAALKYFGPRAFQNSVENEDPVGNDFDVTCR